MQEAFHRVHAHDHSKRYVEKEPVSEQNNNDVGSGDSSSNCFL